MELQLEQLPTYNDMILNTLAHMHDPCNQLKDIAVEKATRALYSKIEALEKEIKDFNTKTEKFRRWCLEEEELVDGNFENTGALYVSESKFGIIEDKLVGSYFLNYQPKNDFNSNGFGWSEDIHLESEGCNDIITAFLTPRPDPTGPVEPGLIRVICRSPSILDRFCIAYESGLVDLEDGYWSFIDSLPPRVKKNPIEGIPDAGPAGDARPVTGPEITKNKNPVEH
jgi:hypothetical protein